MGKLIVVSERGVWVDGGVLGERVERGVRGDRMRARAVRGRG